MKPPNLGVPWLVLICAFAAFVLVDGLSMAASLSNSVDNAGIEVSTAGPDFDQLNSRPNGPLRTETRGHQPLESASTGRPVSYLPQM